MNILYFAPIYYDDMKQRPQQIAECLAKKHTVYYIEPTVSFLRWLLKRGRTFRGRSKRLSKNLYVIRLNGLLTLHKSLEMFDIFGINSRSERCQLSSMIQDIDIVWSGYLGWYTLVRHMRDKMIVFDKMDEEDLLASSFFLKTTLRRNKDRMIALADIVFVSSIQFYEELKGSKDQLYRIPNAVSHQFATVPVSYDRISKIKTFGYVGTMGEWFDLSVIEKILEMDPEYEVVLVGRNYLKEIKNPRVHYMGVKKNRELPALIQSFDVCLYNFKQTSLLDTVNPVKIYEYLSLNKPTLAVKSKETIPLQDYLMIYGQVDEIGKFDWEKVKRPFSNPAELKKFLNNNSWMARAEQMEQILSDIQKKTKARKGMGDKNI